MVIHLPTQHTSLQKPHKPRRWWRCQESLVPWRTLSSCWFFLPDSPFLLLKDLEHNIQPQIFISDGMATTSHTLCKNNTILLLPFFPNTRHCLFQCIKSFCFNGAGGSAAFYLLSAFHPRSSLTFPTFPQSWPSWQHKHIKNPPQTILILVKDMADFDLPLPQLRLCLTGS